EVLRFLDARLPEGIDADQSARGDGRHLEEVEELPEGERTERRQDDRRARPPALRERELGRALLGVQQLGERMAAEIPDALEVLVRRREVDRCAVVLDADEQDDLVGRAVDPELELRVLVGGAERADRRLSPASLPEALGPELTEPVRRRFEPFAV